MMAAAMVYKRVDKTGNYWVDLKALVMAVELVACLVAVVVVQ